MFGDVNVKVEDGNLGRSSSTGTGTSIKIGISNVESKSPILISGTMNAKKIKEKVGNTPLADACIDAVEWGASSIYCIPVKAGTAGTIGKITEDKKGYGTFEVKGSPNSVTKASKSFAFDNIIDEQRDMLKETVEEYPAITISLADKLLRMLGMADTTSVKKL